MKLGSQHYIVLTISHELSDVSQNGNPVWHQFMCEPWASYKWRALNLSILAEWGGAWISSGTQSLLMNLYYMNLGLTFSWFEIVPILRLTRQRSLEVPQEVSHRTVIEFLSSPRIMLQRLQGLKDIWNETKVQTLGTKIKMRLNKVLRGRHASSLYAKQMLMVHNIDSECD